MKSYGQYCGLAKALDVIGDRWTPLIIRELSLREARYSDIRDGLPGIATNLLADRLRHLEAHGVVERLASRPPLATPLYRLTPHGHALVPALHALAAWGGPTLMRGRGDDAFRGRWLVGAIRAMYEGVDCRDLDDVRVRIVTDDEPVDLVLAGGTVRGEMAADVAPDLQIATDPATAIGVLAGQRTLDKARRSGAATVNGSRAAATTLRRLGARVVDRSSV